MIEEQATVVAVRDEEILIAAQRNSACGQCAQHSDCGQSSIAQWAASKMVDIVVAKPAELSISVGDTVVVGIDEKSFVRASILLYFVPLVAMFLAGFIASSASLVEWQVILASFVGLLTSFAVIRKVAGRYEGRATYQLTILSVVN